MKLTKRHNNNHSFFKRLTIAKSLCCVIVLQIVDLSEYFFEELIKHAFLWSIHVVWFDFAVIRHLFCGTSVYFAFLLVYWTFNYVIAKYRPK